MQGSTTKCFRLTFHQRPTGFLQFIQKMESSAWTRMICWLCASILISKTEDLLQCSAGWWHKEDARTDPWLVLLLRCITSAFLGCSFWSLLFIYKITRVTSFKGVRQSLDGLVFWRGASTLSASRKQDWLWANHMELLLSLQANHLLWNILIFI